MNLLKIKFKKMGLNKFIKKNQYKNLIFGLFYFFFRFSSFIKNFKNFKNQKFKIYLFFLNYFFSSSFQINFYEKNYFK